MLRRTVSGLPVIHQQSTVQKSSPDPECYAPQADLVVPIPIADSSVLISATKVLDEPELLQGVTSSSSNIILGKHLSGALIQLLRATHFFEARQQIVRP